MKEFNIFLFEVFTQSKNIPTMAFAFTDTPESAVMQLSSTICDCTTMKMIVSVNWAEFKTQYISADWPKEYQANETGFFAESAFGDVCKFAHNLCQPMMRKYANNVSNKNLN